MKSQFIKNLLNKKSPEEFLCDAEKSHLKKTLNWFDLIVLGIGAVVGTGIFTIVGVAAQGGPEGIGAGPSLVVSMMVAAVACVFSALCYSEFASMIPVAGSVYTYTYATMGEFAAWMVGWVLMLEYAIGNITVASAWTGYFFEFLKGFSHILPAWLVNPPLWLVNDYRTAVLLYKDMGLNPEEQIPHLLGIIPVCLNVPALFIVALVTAVLIKGVKESTKWTGIMVGIKLLVIALFVIVGAFYVRPENWVPFAPNGFKGIFMGSFIIFFAYIGFDAVSTTAEETKNPQRDVPIGILGTLVVCTLIYIAVALVLTGMTPYSQIDFLAPIAHAMRGAGQDWVAGLISIGALVGLTSVLLVYQLGTTRILFAMSRDRFLPGVLQKLHPKYETPHIMTWVAGLVVMAGVLFIDLNISAELCNFGTLLTFMVVCIAVLILRKTDPERPRPFKVPFAPLTPILGILCCGGLTVYSLVKLKTSSILFPVWLLAGAIIYFAYGYKKNRGKEVSCTQEKQTQKDKTPTEVL